jgi:hypothetical protein
VALKTVVTDPFFEAVMNTVRRLESERGTLAFAILNSRSMDPRWDLTLAAPWIDEFPIREIGAEIAAFFRNDLSSDAVEQLRFVRVRTMTDPMVCNLSPVFDVPVLGIPYQVRALESELFSLGEVVVLLARSVSPILHKLSA